ncbi:hypothetical protein WJX77_007616 [Trebouxia sp. C0004]
MLVQRAPPRAFRDALRFVTSQLHCIQKVAEAYWQALPINIRKYEQNIAIGLPDVLKLAFSCGETKQAEQQNKQKPKEQLLLLNSAEGQLKPFCHHQRQRQVWQCQLCGQRTPTEAPVLKLDAVISARQTSDMVKLFRGQTFCNLEQMAIWR